MRYILSIYFLFISLVASCQTKADEAIIEAYLQDTEVCNCNPIIKAALYFLDTPYVANTLECEKEELVINLRGMDCTTLVEYALALAQIKSTKENPQMEDFADRLRAIRYRNGEIDDYSSRLHYISDWITDNEAMGFVIDETKDISKEILPLHLNYMSSHPEAYPALKNNPAMIKKMKEIEKNINQGRPFYYISKHEIENKATDIHDGDIVFFTTSISGLDVQHAAIAYRHNGILGFIHASSKAKKVIIDTSSIADYCLSQKKITGIIVVTPVY